MKINYKIAWILRSDDIHIDKCCVCFYEGDVTTELEKDKDGNLVPVTRYRMLSKIAENIYTVKDFGIISSDDELRVFLNGELKKDKCRTPIDEQNTLDITKVK